MHKHDVFHDLDRFVCNLKTCSRCHVWQQNDLASAYEWKTFCWNIGFRNCCKNYRHKLHQYFSYPWNQEDLTLLKAGYSENFWSRGLFLIPYSKSLITYAMAIMLIIVIYLLSILQVIQQKKMANENYWSQQFFKHH